jgi:hypothetical protein
MDPVTGQIDPVLVILAIVVVFGVNLFLVRSVRNLIMHVSDYLQVLFNAVLILGLGLGGLLAIGLVIGAVGGGVIWLQEQAMMRKCMSAHERAAQARAAPDDYFGKQQRKAAAEEAEECAKFAAKKEAEQPSAKPSGHPLAIFSRP